MNQYITVKGIYEKGNVCLLEVPDQNLVLDSEVMVRISVRKSRVHKKTPGIPINDFLKK
jgi:hypothetical protein